MIGNIVSFRENADYLAAQWCRKHDVLGKVIGEESGMLRIDIGLYYNVYARHDQVQLVSEDGKLSPLAAELQRSAPIPDDGF